MTPICLGRLLLACVTVAANAYAATPAISPLTPPARVVYLTSPSSSVTPSLGVQLLPAPAAAGVPVTFSAPATGPSFTFADGSNSTTVAADAQGVAQVGAFANANPGLVEVQVSAPGWPSTKLSYVIRGPVTLAIDRTVRYRYGEQSGLSARLQVPWFPCSLTWTNALGNASASLTLGGMPVATQAYGHDCDFSNSAYVAGTAHANVVGTAHMLPGTYDYDLLVGLPGDIAPAEAMGTLIVDPDVSVQTASGTVTFSLDYTTGGYYHAGRCASVGAIVGHPGDDGFPASGPPGVDLVNGLVKVDGTQCSWEDFNSFGAPTAPDELIIRQDALLGAGGATLPVGTQAWAYGPTSDNAASHWYSLPTALSGSSAMFQMVDGGAGDNLLARDNEIHGIVALGTPHVSAIPGSFQGLWWAGPQENGWGMSLTQHADRLFAGLFIYDANGDPTWLVMSSGTWNATRTGYSGNLYRPHGSFFGAYDASRFSAGPPVGTLKLTFASLDALTLDYTIDGVSGSKSLQRQLFGPDEKVYAKPMSDLWWGGAAQNGWGLAIAQQYATGFGVLFTYDGSGNPTWFALPAIRPLSAPQPLYSPIYRTHGSPWLGVPYDASRFSATQVGGIFPGFVEGSGYASFAIDGIYVYQPIVAQPF